MCEGGHVPFVVRWKRQDDERIEREAVAVEMYSGGYYLVTWWDGGTTLFQPADELEYMYAGARR